MSPLTPHIGLSEEERTLVLGHLEKVLANTYLLYVKSQIFHWNVMDPRFEELHELFEQHYVALREVVDEAAERMRTLGALTPSGMAAFLEKATLKESSADLSANEMLKTLLEDHEALIRELREAVTAVEETSDHGTADFLTARLQDHEKTAWMLRSHLS